MSAKKKSGSLAWKIFIGILVVVLILAVVAEFGLRWFIGNQMKSQFNAANEEQGIVTEAEPSVSFGASPLIIGMLGGSIPQMTMHTPSTLQINGEEIIGQPEANVEIKRMSLSENPVAGELKTTTTIPDDFLLATFQRGIREQSGMDALGNIIITDIRASESGVLEVDLGGGLAKLDLRPSAQDGALALTAESSRIFGFELPQEASDKISEALTDGLKEQFVGALSLSEVTVESGMVAMTIVGENVPMNEIGGQTGQMGGQPGEPGQNGETGQQGQQEEAPQPAS